MKKCCKCGSVRPLEDFHKNASRRDGRQTYCKPCAKMRNAAYYRATPERNEQRKASRNRGRGRAREFVVSYLSSRACVDCGFADVRALDFDHVRGVKVLGVSEMVMRGASIETISAEIAKCEVRCANCHRIVTSDRAGWHRSATRS